MGTASPLKTATPKKLFFIMTRDLALNLLNSATNGDEILQILESIASDATPIVPAAEPTLAPLNF